MSYALTDPELRVLGCLVEKELATPEYYPLTLNALVAACNQRSNRDPVMALGEAEVRAGLDGLRQKQLALTSAEGVRATKYRHLLAERLRVGPDAQALLAELMLRGPQTVGELRTRAERMHQLMDLPAVEALLDGLAAHDPPLVVRLARQPGRKEARFAHLFAGPPSEAAAAISTPAEIAAPAAVSDAAAPCAPAAPAVASAAPSAASSTDPSLEEARLARLEDDVALLREEAAALRDEVAGLRRALDDVRGHFG